MPVAVAGGGGDNAAGAVGVEGHRLMLIRHAIAGGRREFLHFAVEGFLASQKAPYTASFAMLSAAKVATDIYFISRS